MSVYDDWDKRLSIIPVITAVVGVTLNTACFIIFRFHPEFKKMSSMVFLSFVVVVDTVALLDWNLKHYTVLNFNINIEYVNLFTCKFLPFYQYTSLMCSGMLLSFMSIDRFVTIRSMPGSIYSKMPFGTVKSAYVWSIGIVLTILILNFHILILNGWYEDPVLQNRTVVNVTANGTLFNMTEQYFYQNPNVICYLYKDGFTLSPTWDMVDMFLYSFIPASIMLIFNSLLIYTLLTPSHGGQSADDGRRKENDRNLAKKRRLTRSLIVITFAFIILTLPSTIGWSFLSTWMYDTLPWANLTLDVMDYVSFLNHASVFFSCYITNNKFRNVVTQYSRSVFNSKAALNQSQATMTIINNGTKLRGQ